MPYRLRVTEEEVRQELAKMGYTGLSDDTVAAMRKDLLKMIKSDLRKLKQGREDAEHTDISDPQPHAPPRQHTRHKPSLRTQQAFSPTPKMTYTKEASYSSLSASLTSEDKDESTGESGYSEVESSWSGLSEATSYSSDEISQRESSAEVKQRKPKEAATKELTRKTRGDAASGTYKQPGGMSQVETIAPSKKIISKTKTKQVGKKGLPPYPSRPDPVRLYHYYKAHWDQYKVPGEDPRLKLRWAVRSKLFYAE